ncbi:hypothetical protein R3Q06_34515 [Rhodococcus erythropolis]|uniref:hypothetical protein n=1 Tax=Rhodococcus erythropolis TaxID=1833 RepID=UPI00294A8835|nr:hypothetical protein [Rhodococcus erythropolis]MDV6278516.1 hypothetical protein [Rhodococcus erythropolis]
MLLRTVEDSPSPPISTITQRFGTSPDAGAPWWATFNIGNLREMNNALLDLD